MSSKLNKNFKVSIGLILLVISSLIVTADGWTTQPSHQTLYVDTLTSKTDGSSVSIADSQGLFVSGDVTTLGNIGIGTTTPATTLDVAGRFLVNATAINNVPFVIAKRLTVGTQRPIFVVENSNGEVFRVDGDGSVGIGTASPTYKLDVSGNIHATSDICTDAGGGKCLSNVTGGGSSQWTTSGSNIYYNTGNVGVKNTNPTSELDVTGQLKVSSTINDKIVLSGSQVGPHTIYLTDSKGIRFWDSVNNELVRITNDGKFGIGTTNPSAKLTIAGPNSNTAGDTNQALFFSNSAFGFRHYDDATFGNSLFLDRNFGGWQSVPAMTWLASGNVGIGTASPGDVLHVYKSQNDNTEIAIDNPTAGTAALSALRLMTSGGDSESAGLFKYDDGHSTLARHLRLLNNDAAGDIRFFFNGGDGVTFAQDGNVGIGTAGPGDILEVRNPSTTDQTSIILSHSDGASNPFQLLFGQRGNNNGMSIQSYRLGVGNHALLLNPDGGNVGIGESAPGGLLHLKRSANGAVGPDLILTNPHDSDNSARIEFTHRSSGTSVSRIVSESVGGGDLSNLHFQTEAAGGVATRMTVDEFGNVGIGTTGPDTNVKLHAMASDIGGTSVSADGNERPTIQVEGIYPNIIIKGSGNAQHSATLGLWSFDGAATTHQWNIGVGQNGIFSMGYVSNKPNPHAGLQNYDGNSVMTMLTSGYVGIGTTNPYDSKLHVHGGDESSRIIRAHASSTSFNSRIMTLSADRSQDSAYVFMYATSDQDGSPDNEFVLRGDGNAFADGSWSGGGADVAEWIPTSDKSLGPGDVVVVDGSSRKSLVKKSSGSKNEVAIGIISTSPGLVAGIGEAENGKNISETHALVALAGRVPVKVTNEGGMIIAGDRLSMSLSIPGHARKMTEPGQSIGIALEDSLSETGKIIALVNVGYHEIEKAKKESGKEVGPVSEAILLKDTADGTCRKITLTNKELSVSGVTECNKV